MEKTVAGSGFVNRLPNMTLRILKLKKKGSVHLLSVYICISKALFWNCFIIIAILQCLGNARISELNWKITKKNLAL